MTADELRAMCLKSDFAHLVLRRRAGSRLGDRVRLCGGYGPLGRLCNVQQRADGDWDVAAVFESKKVLAFLRRAEKKAKEAE